MEYITRDHFDKVIKNKHYIDLEELVKVIESEFGYYVKLEEKNKDTYTDKQKKEMSKLICNDPGVVKQLKESLLESDEEYIEEEEEFIRLIREAQANE